MAAKGYATIALPDRLVEQIDEVVAIGAWASRAEFVKDAVRRYLEQISTHREVAPDA